MSVNVELGLKVMVEHVEISTNAKPEITTVPPTQIAPIPLVPSIAKVIQLQCNCYTRWLLTFVHLFTFLPFLGCGNISRASPGDIVKNIVWNSAYAQTTYLIFGMIKNVDNIYYQKSSVWVVWRRRFGHFTMKHIKNNMTISPPTHNPRTWFLLK